MMEMLPYPTYPISSSVAETVANTNPHLGEEGGAEMAPMKSSPSSLVAPLLAYNRRRPLTSCRLDCLG